MSTPPPPVPPQRKTRRPFVTVFLEFVLPYADAKSLLVCRAVSRGWHLEAENPSLWRRLCADAEGLAAYTTPSLRELQRGVLRRQRPVVDVSAAVPTSRAPARTVRAATLPFALQHQSTAPTSLLFSAGLQYRLHPVDGGAWRVDEALTGYACASPRAVLRQRIDALDRAVQILLQTHVPQQARKVQEHGAELARLQQAVCRADAEGAVRRRCTHLLKCVSAFETMVTQTVLHGAPIETPTNSGVEADLPVCVPSPAETARLRGVRAVSSFVQLELLLCTHVATLPAANARWRRLQACVPIDDGYYDFVELLQAHSTPNCRGAKLFYASGATPKWLDMPPYAELQAKLTAVLTRRADAGRGLMYDELVQCLSPSPSAHSPCC